MKWLTDVRSWRKKTAEKSRNDFRKHFRNISEERTVLGQEKYVELMSEVCDLLL